VVIVGGGPAGCATALSLVRHDPSNRLRILVIDDADPSAFKIGESLPALAKRTLPLLSPALSARLAQDTAARHHASCSGNASAWASPRLHSTPALLNPYGAGWHLDRARFDETLRDACRGSPSERLGLRKGRFVAVRRVDEGCGVRRVWEVDAEMVCADTGSGTSAGEAALETFRARWVVDATGRRASLARKLGAKPHKHADLLAFYIVFRTPHSAPPDHSSDPDPDPDPGRSSPTGPPLIDDDDKDTRTLIEAAPSGWWYTARLPHGQRLVAYTTAPTDPTARVARRTPGFLDMLRTQTTHVAAALGLDLGTESESEGTERAVYEPQDEARFTRSTAAGSAVLAPYAAWEPDSDPDLDPEVDVNVEGGGRGWCAVGDAALAFDPLSSQGIITALNAGAFLGGVLARHLLADASDGYGSHLMRLSGEAAVEEITRAYEKVRVKYEAGRAYYYDIVRRFDGENQADDGGAREGGKANFWRTQRREPFAR
ncbi:hypothetical protein C8Q79DRAFT_919950, partial [Trametes meyenii]